MLIWEARPARLRVPPHRRATRGESHPLTSFVRIIREQVTRVQWPVAAQARFVRASQPLGWKRTVRGQGNDQVAK